MANNVSHSTVDRAYAVATITILYKNDSPDAPGLYFRELKETNEMAMMVWDGKLFILNKIIPKRAYDIIVSSNGYK